MVAARLGTGAHVAAGRPDMLAVAEARYIACAAAAHTDTLVAAHTLAAVRSTEQHAARTEVAAADSRHWLADHKQGVARIVHHAQLEVRQSVVARREGAGAAAPRQSTGAACLAVALWRALLAAAPSLAGAAQLEAAVQQGEALRCLGRD